MSLSKKDVMRYRRRRNRSKKHTLRHPNRYRLVVARSLKNIQAQIVDDSKGHTLASASSLDRDLREAIQQAGSKVEQSRVVGATLAKKAKEKKIKSVVFDRNGFPYTGRVKALAEAARAEGLDF